MASEHSYSFGSDPSAEDAAAVIAAIERFLADTTVPSVADSDAVSGWLRAALQEGVGSTDTERIW
jgi:hypothetical protein